MDRVLQAQENALNAFQKNIQPGRLSGILVFFEGTNDTGQTGTSADCGSVTIKRNGVTIVNRTVQQLALMGDIRAGSNRSASATAGAFLQSIFIPFFALGLPNALNITGPSELNFDYQPSSGAGTVFASLTVSVYSQVEFEPESYQYFILGEDQTPAGAVSSRPYQLNRDNVTEVYITDPDTVLTSVGLRQSGEQRFSDQPLEVLKAGTLYDNMLETSDTDMVLLKCYTLGRPESAVNQNSIIQLTTSGSGTVPITVCSIA